MVEIKGPRGISFYANHGGYRAIARDGFILDKYGKDAVFYSDEAAISNNGDYNLAFLYDMDKRAYIKPERCEGHCFLVNDCKKDEEKPQVRSSCVYYEYFSTKEGKGWRPRTWQIVHGPFVARSPGIIAKKKEFLLKDLLVDGNDEKAFCIDWTWAGSEYGYDGRPYPLVAERLMIGEPDYHALMKEIMEDPTKVEVIFADIYPELKEKHSNDLGAERPEYVIVKAGLKSKTFKEWQAEQEAKK